MQYKYKFSVIIPVYNVEEYLEQTILSVINQSIGFEKNVQLILINDGSPDDSESICLKYKEMYPNNIVYYKQENAGVSVARNKGMEFVLGEIVNFLDSDDTWSKDALKVVWKMAKKYQDINLFSCRMRFFDAVKRAHPLNYKYKEDKIVSILEDYEYPQLSSSSIFIKEVALRGHQYDKNIKYSEDNKLINEILLEQEKYMVLKKPTYYYRRRAQENSAIQSQTQRVDWYLKTPKDVYEYLYQLSIEKYGKVIPYIQFLIMYEINWRLSVKRPTFLTKSQLNHYENMLFKLLEQIDDEVVLKLKNADLSKKVFLLSLKHKKNYIKKIEYTDKFAKLGDFEVPINNLGYLIVDRIYLKNNKMYLYGKLDIKFVSKNKFKILLNDKAIIPQFYELTNNYDGETFNGDTLHTYIGFHIEISINENFNLYFMYGDVLLTPRFKRSSIFYEKMPRSYKVSFHKIITFKKKKKQIVCQENNIFLRIFYELWNDLYLIKWDKAKVAFIRLLISFVSTFKRKKIMLISDRVNKADDNGEHFFLYMLNNHPEYKCYFVVSKDSSDYTRLMKYGPVLDNNSTKYKLLFQVCDYVVSSQAEDYVFNVLGKNNKFVQDKYRFKYVFLQHGIIKDDLSPWLNINTKKMDMFVTSCDKEYQSLLDCKYYYGPNIVKLTGLPRYDTLIHKQKDIQVKKQILLSCTWRNSLASKINKKTGERIYNDKFKESNYYLFLNELINNKRLLRALEKYDYRIKFCPHPNVLVQLRDFKENKYVIIDTEEVNYQKEFCENALLITDYSSVFFDFAYLKKPVIYIQHDRKEFFEGQLYNEGYFDYKKMGFGPVVDNLEDTIDAIIKSIENDCKMDSKYLKRVEEFYTYHDDKNCDRVLKEIEKL